MIILHAAWHQARLHLWGEATPEAQAAGKKSARTAGRRAAAKAATSAVAPHPFDADRTALLAAVTPELPELADDVRLSDAAVWLPTVGRQPLASSPLIAAAEGAPQADGQAVLAAWRVTALPLKSAQAIELLAACAGRETLAPGVIVGVDVAYWAVALRFGAALVARQQFLPGVRGEAGGWRAIWEPVFLGPETNRLTHLQRAMPHACRALTEINVAAPPATPASAVLADFLREAVDGLVRSAAAAPTVARRPATARKRAKAAAEFESLHDQWLHALGTDDGALTGAAGELQQLAEQVREWQRPLAASAAAPFRLCFRLEEPKAGEPRNGKRIAAAKSDWYVRYLLQAADDPSLLVPAADVWTAKGRQAALLKRGAFNPREYLLAALGQAAGVSPRIERSLKAAAPAGYELDAAGAHEFLRETAWLLEQSGFGVLLPAWWTRKGTKQRLSVTAKVSTPKFTGGGVLTLEEVVKFDWEVALGEQKLTQQELEALARLKAPLVKVRGQWVELNAEEIQAALEFWKKKDGGKASVREVVRMALGAGETPQGLAVTGVEATGWLGEFLAQLEGRATFAELEAPPGFRGTLRPYQTRGYSWLDFLRSRGLGACLADDMGLGKTIQVLALLQHDWAANSRKPVLIVCPMSVVGNWQKEAERFTPELPVLVHHGAARGRGAAFKRAAGKHALVISSYALLHRDAEIFQQVAWGGLVLDEAQNIKNAQTKQARAARALKAGYRVALTGTPVENNVGDLWSIMEFLNPGWLGTQADFKRRFFVPIQAARDEAAAAALRRLTGPFILRRLKTDRAIISDLPEKNEMKVYCTLTKEQASLYEAVVGEAAEEIEASEGIRRKGVVLATLSLLKQVCNHPAHFLGDNSALAGRSGKLQRLGEMLEEALAAGDRALVFTQFAEMGELLRRYLQETFGREVLFLHGAVPKRRRDEMVARFQNDADGPRLFILSLKAGGTGLNLTAANHVFHFDRWWNPAVENQATDRAFRIGQRRDVQVHKFVCAGTLEEKIDEMIERKQALAEHIVGGGEGWLTELSNAALKELMALRAEAVSE